MFFYISVWFIITFCILKSLVINKISDINCLQFFCRNSSFGFSINIKYVLCTSCRDHKYYIHVKLYYISIYCVYFILSVIWTNFLRSHPVIDTVSISELSLILKIICQCDVKHIRILPIKIMVSVLNISTYIITSIKTRSLRLVIMSVSTFITTVILYIVSVYLLWLLYIFCIWYNNDNDNLRCCKFN